MSMDNRVAEPGDPAVKLCRAKPRHEEVARCKRILHGQEAHLGSGVNKVTDAGAAQRVSDRGARSSPNGTERKHQDSHAVHSLHAISAMKPEWRSYELHGRSGHGVARFHQLPCG